MNALAGFLARALEADEREAVLGDVAERPQTAVRDVLGLVIRRQFQVWLSWQPWVVLVLATLPFAFWVSLTSRYASDGSAITLWLYFGRNWDWNLFSIQMFRHDILVFLGSMLFRLLYLVCWSWNLGLLLRRFSRSSLAGQIVFFFLAMILGAFFVAGYAAGSGFNGPNAEVFRVEFYRIYYPAIVLLVLGWLPALAGMFHVDRIRSLDPAWSKAIWVAALLPVVMVVTRGILFWLVGPAHRPVLLRVSLAQLLAYCPFWPLLYWIAVASPVRYKRLWARASR